MNTDQSLRERAKELFDFFYEQVDGNGEILYCDKQNVIIKINKALQAVRDEEREACAQIAENFIPDQHQEHEACSDCAMTRAVASTIRNQGATKS